MVVWFSCCGLIACNAGFEVGLFWFVDWRIVIVYFCVLFDFWYYRFSVVGSVVGLCLGVGDLRCGVGFIVCLFGHRFERVGVWFVVGASLVVIVAVAVGLDLFGAGFFCLLIAC